MEDDESKPEPEAERQAPRTAGGVSPPPVVPGGARACREAEEVVDGGRGNNGIMKCTTAASRARRPSSQFLSSLSTLASPLSLSLPLDRRCRPP